MYKFLLPLVSLFLITTCGGGDTTTGSVIEMQYEDHVSVTGKQVCSVINKKLECAGGNWISGSLILLPAPPITDAVEYVSVGHNHACALSEGNIQCWGENTDGELDVPILSDPYLLASGDGFSCAADGAGLNCWGYQGGSYCTNSSGGTCISSATIQDPTSHPDLSNVTDLSSSNYYTCAITDGQVECWGHASYGQLSAPALEGATQITTGDFHACALTSSGTHCWGYGDLNKNLPQDFHPNAIAAGQGFTCGIDEISIQCWGEASVTGSTYKAPILEQSLSNPTSVSAGSDLVCVIDDNGRTCFGDISQL